MTLPDGEGPHLLRDLMVVQGMYLIRFLEITGHLCKDLTIADTYIHGKTESVADLVLDGVSNGNRIRIDLMGT